MIDFFTLKLLGPMEIGFVSNLTKYHGDQVLMGTESILKFVFYLSPPQHVGVIYGNLLISPEIKNKI